MKNLFSFAILCTTIAALTFSTSCKKEEDPEPSNPNTELVKQMFAYFGAGDIPSFLAKCDPNCVFDITGNQILNPGKVYNGTEGFMQFLGDLSSKGQPTSIVPLEFYESGNVVTVTGNIVFNDFTTNQQCNVNFIQLWEFENGKMVYFKEDHDNRVCQ